MNINQIFELSMELDNERFQKVLSKIYNGTGHWKETEDGCIDWSLFSRGITIVCRNSRYRKKVRLIVNTYLLADDVSDTGKLLRKLDKRVSGYFNCKYHLNDFALSGMCLTVDIDVGSRKNAADYLNVLQRVGKVKGFSPITYDCFDNKASFCLSGNSNGVDFMLYDLEKAVTGQLRGRKQAKGILRAEVRLTKPKAIRACTDVAHVSGQLAELSGACQDIFMDTFTRIIPFGDFYKKDKAAEIVWKEVKDSVMRRKMLRLLALIPEKKSLHLAQKAMNCRNIEKVMDAFAKINLSPVTISKRHDVKYLKCLYEYLFEIE